MVEITQWLILIALFSQCVPPSRVCYCRTGGYAGQGADAEPAESEHFLSNNFEILWGSRRGGSVQEGRCRGSGCLLVGAGTKCKINQGLCYVKGERRS